MVTLALLPRPSPRLSLASRAAAWTGSRAAWALGSTAWSTRRHSCPHWCTKICHLDLVLHPRAVAWSLVVVGMYCIDQSTTTDPGSFTDGSLAPLVVREWRRYDLAVSATVCRFCTCLTPQMSETPPMCTCYTLCTARVCVPGLLFEI